MLLFCTRTEVSVNLTVELATTFDGSEQDVDDDDDDDEDDDDSDDDEEDDDDANDEDDDVSSRDEPVDCLRFCCCWLTNFSCF